MGFAWLGALALLTLILLWLLKLRGPLLTIAGAAVAFGCAGYALQGRPDLPGMPRTSAERPPPMTVAGARHALMGQFDYSDTWLNMADALASRGDTKDAVNLLRTQIARHPGDYKLWVGLGNALFDHSGTLSPRGSLCLCAGRAACTGLSGAAFLRRTGRSPLRQSRGGGSPLAPDIGRRTGRCQLAPAGRRWGTADDERGGTLAPPPAKAQAGS